MNTITLDEIIDPEKNEEWKSKLQKWLTQDTGDKSPKYAEYDIGLDMNNELMLHILSNGYQTGFITYSTGYSKETELLNYGFREGVKATKHPGIITRDGLELRIDIPKDVTTSLKNYMSTRIQQILPYVYPCIRKEPVPYDSYGDDSVKAIMDIRRYFRAEVTLPFLDETERVCWEVVKTASEQMCILNPNFVAGRYEISYQGCLMAAAEYLFENRSFLPEKYRNQNINAALGIITTFGLHTTEDTDKTSISENPFFEDPVRRLVDDFCYPAIYNTVSRWAINILKKTMKEDPVFERLGNLRSRFDYQYGVPLKDLVV